MQVIAMILKIKNFHFPDSEQTVRGDLRQANECAIQGKTSIGDNGMDMGMIMYQLAKGLDAGDHAGEDVFSVQNLAVGFGYGFPRCSRQVPQ